MKRLWIVIDTNVFLAALRSTRGASYRLMMLIDSDLFEPAVSVALLLEYESVAKRHGRQTGLAASDVEDILDFVCSVAAQCKIFYLWRPALKDPKDDMVLELAVAAGCEYIVTFNVGDFAGSERFGVGIATPQEFLAIIGELP